MRECIKAFANIIAADFVMKLLIWRNSRSWWKQVLTTDEICLSIDISDWTITPRFFAHSLGEMVFKLRLMLTGINIDIFWIKQVIFSFIRIITDSLFPIIHENISLMQVSIDVKVEKTNSGENDKYIWVSSAWKW